MRKRLIQFWMKISTCLNSSLKQVSWNCRQDVYGSSPSPHYSPPPLPPLHRCACSTSRISLRPSRPSCNNMGRLVSFCICVHQRDPRCLFMQMKRAGYISPRGRINFRRIDACARQHPRVSRRGIHLSLLGSGLPFSSDRL